MFDFTILVLEGAYASSVAATLDILGAATRLAPRVGVAAPTWRLVGVAGPVVSLQGGMSVKLVPIARLSHADDSTWIVPGLGLEQPEFFDDRLEHDDAKRAVALLQRYAQWGGQIAASCSAVFLLQRAGVLAGRRVTTTWWLAPTLQSLEPACVVDADRMVCADGPLVTAGAAFAQADLMLHLLRVRCGHALTDAVSRALLIDARQAQAPFIVPEVLANGDALVGRLADRIDKALPAPPAISQLASEFGMSERTLSRRVQRATGKSTLALVQSVRLRRARTLLESSRMTVEQVAEAVGYQDSTALRRMMRKLAGANPSRFRAVRVEGWHNGMPMGE